MAVLVNSLTTDASGDATITFNVEGYVDTIAIDYAADAGATTDVTITGYLGSYSFTMYSKTDSITDAIVRPRVAVQDNAGNNVTYDGTNEIYERYLVDRITITIAQGGASKTDVVTLGVIRNY